MDTKFKPGSMPGNTWHRLTKSPEWRTWQGLKGRCCNPLNLAYAHYGGRGITVCERWMMNFLSFLADMGARPSPAHSIERIDNNGPYSPENCRWATRKEQASNRRSTQALTYKGETLTVQEWARRTGIKAPALYWRLHAGWDAERTLTTPVAPTYTYNGETLTLRQWSDRLGIEVTALQWRLHNWTVERALSAPLR